MRLTLLLLMIFYGCGGSGDAPPADPVPAHETLRIPSTVLQEERVINIWLPPQYTASTDSFAVLYMPDGGIKEDFPHIANTIAALVAGGEIAPVILVGIENTQRRRDLTGPSSVPEDAEIAPISDGAALFRSFIATELMLEIEKRYRTRPQRAIVGESAAGLFIVETFLLQPDLFEIYIAMDPAIYWNDHSLVKMAPQKLGEFPDHPITLWFAASDVIDIYPYNDQLAKVLEEHAPVNLRWKYQKRMDLQHGTIFRATKEGAFKWAMWPASGTIPSGQ